MTSSSPSQGLVLGGGIAGLLAARVLADHLDMVRIVDRDRLPNGPVPRSGTPQARHSHALMSSGVCALESLLPGTTQALIDAGARRIAMPEDTVILSPQGWLRRIPGDRFFLACTRDLLEFVIRQQVLQTPGISVTEACEVVGLLGDAHTVTGASVRDRTSGAVRQICADFVIDATGRESRAPLWLNELGLGRVSETVLDPGLGYATRLFRAPDQARNNFPTVMLQPGSETSRPGRGGIVLPVEEGHWIVTLTGTRGGVPPVDEDGFMEFARTLQHPVIYELMAAADPIGPVRGFRCLGNRRRDYHRMASWPVGFAVIGDAVTMLNPVYGHGMSVAIVGVTALRDGLARHGLDPGAGKKVQKAVAHAANLAWLLATVQDARRPLTTGHPMRFARVVNWFIDRLNAAATERPAAARAVADLFTLSQSLPAILSPAIFAAVLAGRRKKAPTAHPPFTHKEIASLGCEQVPSSSRQNIKISVGKGEA